jgi:A/G-specific adenine glycosylase
VSTAWRPLAGRVRHGFTHFQLELAVYAGASDAPAPAGAVWVAVDRLGDWALPTLMKKVVRHALAKA